MLESFFISVNNWMTAGSLYAAMGSFAWGMISVLFSPCHLASIPLIVAYVAGQETAVNPKKAGWFAGAFTLGLFITIALIGLICAWLGRMLGDVGIWWQILVGGVLIWVALGMLGVEACTLSGSLLYRLNIRGVYGAFVLGLAYWGFIRVVHVRIYRTDPGNRHRSAGGHDGYGPDSVVCFGTLSSHYDSGQFDRMGA